MSIIIIGLLVVIIILLAKSKSNGVESLGNASQSQRQQAQAFNKSGTAAEVVTVKPYTGSTKMSAIKAIREVNHVIGLKGAKAIVDNGGELEIYVAPDQLFSAKEMMRETGLEF
ncbi:hypothetical protein R2F61_03590 [Mollicutes bacterium LVI A0078]|nr:hypothetical protein RZE84_03620 [Mollicutes bacterium LVI A0075]WOO91646.1 hypothetical protein R2F61_03590 [Mollicutes bacterium LVI A0078]